MPAPSSLAIATSALQRLHKEHIEYQHEISAQQSRIAKAEQADDEDGNKAYIIRQEQTALKETERMIPELQQKINHARDKVELELSEAKEGEDAAKYEADIKKAEEVLSLSS